MAQIPAMTAATFASDELAGIPVVDDAGEELGVAEASEPESFSDGRAYFHLTIGDEKFLVEFTKL